MDRPPPALPREGKQAANIQAKIVALYRVRYDDDAGGGQGIVHGTLEGVLIVPCVKPA